jgi:DNA-binding transcriptional MerR regulator
MNLTQQKTTNVDKASKIYGISRSSIHRYIKIGLITPTKVSGRMFLSIDQLDNLFLGDNKT